MRAHHQSEAECPNDSFTACETSVYILLACNCDDAEVVTKYMNIHAILTPDTIIFIQNECARQMMKNRFPVVIIIT